MNCAEIGVLEESDQISLCGLLQRQNGGGLEPELLFELMCQLPHQPLEGKLSDEQISTLLILANFADSDGPWAEPMRFLHATGCRRWRCLPSDLLGNQLLPGHFLPSGFPRSLLSSRHESYLFLINTP